MASRAHTSRQLRRAPSSSADRAPAPSLAGYTNGSCAAATATCYLIAWCPAEEDGEEAPDTNVLPEVESFLLRATASIKFPFAQLVATNGRKGHDVFGVNLFEVAAILRETNTTFDDVARNGAVFSISFNFDCNLDREIESCAPQVSFDRLDDPADTASPGYSFRYSTYSVDKAEGTQYRYLRRAYGLRFLIESTGRGRTFDWATIIECPPGLHMRARLWHGAAPTRSASPLTRARAVATFCRSSSARPRPSSTAIGVLL